MHISASELRGRQIYQLMTSALIPRPIAWVGTRSKDGNDNLAPFSYFMGVSSKPPALAISVARPGRDALKDTARNILETGVFTVSMVSVASLQQMVDTSARWPSELSEFEAVNLRMSHSHQVAASYPECADVAMECRLIHTHEMATNHLFVGEISIFHLSEKVHREDEAGNPFVDAAELDPVARLGGREYTTLGSIRTAAPRSIQE